ncbi:MAG: hypothetical protein H6R26_2135 [Proteobacteria bacterium]|nr:hypothetical protein [Pseudomonadota bacterium]
MQRPKRAAVTSSVVCIIAAASAMIVLGKDFWITKPYSAWNEQEALALLTNSPWSYPTTIQGNYGGSSSPTMAGGGARSVATTGGLGGSDSVTMYVRWHSSMKVRQALARYGQLRGGLSEPEIQQFLAQPMEDYTIAISCPVMDSFAAATFESLSPRTFLTSRKNKEKKIALKAYSSPVGRADNFALFMFPRELDGKPTVEPADEEIVFSTQIGALKIRASFKLARMTIDGTPDL